jgi:hypothetical protein
MGVAAWHVVMEAVDAQEVVEAVPIELGRDGTEEDQDRSSSFTSFSPS